MKLFTSFITAVVLPVLSSAHDGNSVVEIPNSVYNGTIESELISTLGGFDGQKIHPRPNATSFDWWYFDAASTSSTNESIVIVFYEAGPESLDFPGRPLLYVDISGSFANGTTFYLTIPAGDAAIIEQGPNGIRGEWQDTGASFSGTSLNIPNPVYTVTVDSSEFGIHGKLLLRSRAPAHYPCDLNKPGVTEEVIPRIGWANAVPDSHAVAEFTIGGTELSFTGTGYHDKNWGDVPLRSTTQSWYWGHANLGPYSLVWFDTRTPNGTEYYAGYVAKNGDVLQVSCATEAVKVRPFGNNSEYPPTPETGTPDGFQLVFDLGGGVDFVVNATTQLVQFDIGLYQRFLGKVEGEIGGRRLEGKALYEQFKYAL